MFGECVVDGAYATFATREQGLTGEKDEHYSSIIFDFEVYFHRSHIFLVGFILFHCTISLNYRLETAKTLFYKKNFVLVTFIL